MGERFNARGRGIRNQLEGPLRVREPVADAAVNDIPDIAEKNAE